MRYDTYDDGELDIAEILKVLQDWLVGYPGAHLRLFFLVDLAHVDIWWWYQVDMLLKWRSNIFSIFNGLCKAFKLDIWNVFNLFWFTLIQFKWKIHTCSSCDLECAFMAFDGGAEASAWFRWGEGFGELRNRYSATLSRTLLSFKSFFVRGSLRSNIYIYIYIYIICIYYIYFIFWRLIFGFQSRLSASWRHAMILLAGSWVPWRVATVARSKLLLLGSIRENTGETMELSTAALLMILPFYLFLPFCPRLLKTWTGRNEIKWLGHWDMAWGKRRV